MITGNFTLDGKKIVARTVDSDNNITRLVAEDKTVYSYDQAVQLIEDGKSENLFIHPARDTERPIISTKRTDDDVEQVTLEDLPIVGDEHVTYLKIEGKKIDAVHKTTEGRIQYFRTEEGKEYGFAEVIPLIQEGKTEGLELHQNNAGFDVISAVRGTEPDNLDALPEYRRD